MTKLDLSTSNPIASSSGAPPDSPCSPAGQSSVVQADPFDSIGCLRGEEADRQSGLVLTHIEQMQVLADFHRVVIMMRPVNQHATGLIEQGCVPKGMPIKAKSSDWGPMAGYIPSDPSLSKQWATYVTNASPPVVESVLTKSAETSYFSRPLALSPERLHYLLNTNPPLIEVEPHPDGDLQQLLVTLPRSSPDNPGPDSHFRFRLLPTSDGDFSVEYQRILPNEDHEQTWRPVDVLHAYVGQDPISEKSIEQPYALSPITADYDVFAYIPHLASPLLPPFNPSALPAPSASASASVSASSSASVSNWGRLISRLSESCLTENRWQLVANPVVRLFNHLSFNHLGILDRTHFKPNIGREPDWQAKFRRLINTALSPGSPHLVKHATEMDNLNHPEYDKNILIVVPDRSDRLLTKDWTQVQASHHAARLQGYVGYANRTYLRPYQVEEISSNPLDYDAADINQDLFFDPHFAYLESIKKTGGSHVE